MRNSRRHRRSSVERLRLAIDCLPLATRQAMLAGVRSSERIIAGAYVDNEGGVCPMLAAHRRGGRTDFLAFAKSWDRFTRAKRKSRVASTRERAMLLAQLEASLLSASTEGFDRAIAEHRALRASRMRRRRALLSEAEPAGEIVARRLRDSRSNKPVDARALAAPSRTPATALAAAR